MFNNIIMKYVLDGIVLDKYQSKAVYCNKKKYLVVAGAGSGKTLTIRAKIDYLIKNGINPRKILCLSFTNETVNELKSKTVVDVMTFHKFAVSLIPKDKYQICTDSLLRYVIDEYFESFIYDGTDELLNIYLQDYGLVREYFLNNFKGVILSFINTFKSYGYSFEYFLRLLKDNSIPFYDKILLVIVFKIYYLYEEEKSSRNLMDFNDILILGTEYVDKNNYYKYQYIIIDEYQDTSYLRYKLIDKLANKYSLNVISFGDDYQSIYGFNGCDLDIFLRYKGPIVKLKNTYRCPKDIVDISYRFIRKNKRQLRKRLISTKYLKDSINVVYTNDATSTFNTLIKDLDDILILGRNNKDQYLINNGDLNYENKSIRFLTAHSAKGLESDYVFIVNAVDDTLGFPNKIREYDIFKYIKNDDQDNEERRLFYVALTRARKKVFIFTNKVNPSCFVKELLKDYKFKIKTFNFT